MGFLRPTLKEMAADGTTTNSWEDEDTSAGLELVDLEAGAPDLVKSMRQLLLLQLPVVGRS